MEKLKKVGEKAEEYVKKIASSLDEVAQKLEKRDIYALSRNIILLSVTAMTVYTCTIAFATAIPVATQLFGFFGFILGISIQLMILSLMFSLVASLIRSLLKR